jgi:hypothetical protein
VLALASATGAGKLGEGWEETKAKQALLPIHVVVRRNLEWLRNVSGDKNPRWCTVCVSSVRYIGRQTFQTGRLAVSEPAFFLFFMTTPARFSDLGVMAADLCPSWDAGVCVRVYMASEQQICLSSPLR